MANQDIDPSQRLLNELDNELILLDRLMFEVKGEIAMLKFLCDKLRKAQVAFTKH